MAEPVKRRLPWTKIILFVSLALNLAVAGVVIGAMTQDKRGGDRGPGLRDAGFGPYASALSRADRLKLGLALRREDGPFLASRAEMREAFVAVITALRAEPYDHAALVAAISAQETLVRATQASARDVLLTHIAEMDDAERLDYARALENWRSRRGSGHKGGK